MSGWLRNPSHKIKKSGAALVVAGLSLALTSFAADALGWSQHPDVFGYRQIGGVLAGLTLLTLGIASLVTPPGYLRTQVPRWWRRVYAPRPAATPWPRWLAVAVLLCTIWLGTALRLHALDSQSLWLDELFTWRDASHSDVREVVAATVRDVWPPGFNILMHWSVRAFGDSEFALRFPAALAGILCIPAIYALGRRLYTTREGLVAAGLMAVLRVAIEYAQEARAYSLLILLAIVATHFWVGMLRRFRRNLPPNLAETLGYVAAALALAYVHYFGLFLVGLQGAAAALMLCRRRTAWPGLVATYGLALLGYLPWASEMLADLGTASFWIAVPGSLAQELGAFLLFLFNDSAALLAIVVTVSGLGFFNLLRSKHFYGDAASEPLISGTLWLLLWLLLPFAIAYTRSLFATPILSHRYLLISLPAACLLVARGFTHLPLKPPAAGFVFAGLLASFLAQLLLAQPFYSNPSKTQYREAVFAVAEQDVLYPDSAIIGQNWLDGEDLNYYFRLAGSERRVDILEYGAVDVPRVASILSDWQPRYVWFVEVHLPAPTEFKQYLNGNFHLVEHQAFFNADVWLYQNPSAH